MARAPHPSPPSIADTRIRHPVFSEACLATPILFPAHRAVYRRHPTYRAADLARPACPTKPDCERDFLALADLICRLPVDCPAVPSRLGSAPTGPRDLQPSLSLAGFQPTSVQQHQVPVSASLDRRAPVPPVRFVPAESGEPFPEALVATPWTGRTVQGRARVIQRPFVASQYRRG